MSTHNMCFHGEIRKIFCGYPLLSGALGSTGVMLICQVSLFFQKAAMYARLC